MLNEPGVYPLPALLDLNQITEYLQFRAAPSSAAPVLQLSTTPYLLNHIVLHQ